MQCCNKHVIIYSGARVSELIRAIRSFISIDLMQVNLLLFTLLNPYDCDQLHIMPISIQQIFNKIRQRVSEKLQLQG